MPLMEQEEHLQEYAAVLNRQLSSGTAETATRPKWHDQLNTAVVPVNGINTSEEPLIIRIGERVALGTKLASTTVALLEEVPAQESGWDTSLCDEGTVVKGMKTETEHSEQDWRRGLTWKQIIAGTRQEGRNEEFLRYSTSVKRRCESGRRKDRTK